MNTAVNLQITRRAGNLLTTKTTISFSDILQKISYIYNELGI
jgi:hypothetical protein